MKKYLSLILLSITLVSTLVGKEANNKQFVTLSGNARAGMFSCVITVMGLADYFEKQKYSGFTVDFGDMGVYYDRKLGKNWWNYYFEPIYEGEIIKEQLHTNDKIFCKIFFHIEKGLSRKRCRTLIKRYIHLKPKIQNIIDDYADEHFNEKPFIIGVHYRGTDKYTESPRIEYDVMINAINNVCVERNISHPHIFVATDEENFVEYIKSKFPNRVMTYNSLRSKGDVAVHFDRSITDRYRLGVDAIVDAYLLGKCHYLIRTSSNLSLFSKMLNPHLPVLELSQRKPREGR